MYGFWVSMSHIRSCIHAVAIIKYLYFLLILVLYQFLYSYLHCLVILSIIYQFYPPFNSLAICLHSIATSKSFLFIYFPDLL